MVHVSIARGWELLVQRGPDWLFVRPHHKGSDTHDLPGLADQVWQLLEQNFTYRVLLELGEIKTLDSELIGELVTLEKRVTTQGGVLRLCGLSKGNEELLQLCGLEGRLPTFRNREEAVMGNSRPMQPR